MKHSFYDRPRGEFKKKAATEIGRKKQRKEPTPEKKPTRQELLQIIELQKEHIKTLEESLNYYTMDSFFQVVAPEPTASVHFEELNEAALRG